MLVGFDYNPLDGLMYAIRGPNTAATIVSFDLDTFTETFVANVPDSAYGGLVFSFDGVAVGNGRVFLSGNRTSSTPIAVFNLTTRYVRSRILPDLSAAPRTLSTRVAPRSSRRRRWLRTSSVRKPSSAFATVHLFPEWESSPMKTSWSTTSRRTSGLGCFDGSQLGLGPLTISALAVRTDGSMLLSFTAPGTIPGLIGGPDGEVVDDSDIVRFVPTGLRRKLGNLRVLFRRQ